MQEKRRHERAVLALELNVTTATGDTKTYITRDVSDGGVFVLASYHDQMPLGAAVTITPTSHAHEWEPPTMRARVARRTGQGMAIEFLDPGFVQSSNPQP